MRLVIQRVAYCSVVVDGCEVGKIDKGFVVLVGIEEADGDEDIEWLASKLSKMRLFDDENGVMNLSVNDINGDVMVISQFTLFASTKKGNRCSYIKAARPEIASPLFDKFKDKVKSLIKGNLACGIFGADMKVSLLNDGPVTIIVDSKNRE